MATITLNLSTDVESKLRKRAAAKGIAVADAALELVEIGLSEVPISPSADDLRPEQRLQSFREHMQAVDQRPEIDVVLDDSRESVYEGRGE